MFLLPTAALADCLPDAAGTTVTCQISDPDGYNGSAVNGLTVNVASGTNTVAGTISTGTGSVVNNEGDINVSGGTAISMGGGSSVNNATTATGAITGDIVFGATTEHAGQHRQQLPEPGRQQRYFR